MRSETTKTAATQETSQDTKEYSVIIPLAGAIRVKVQATSEVEAKKLAWCRANKFHKEFELVDMNVFKATRNELFSHLKHEFIKVEK